jgi:ABC-type multidrug transport system fused ATPase/permease subunit
VPKILILDEATSALDPAVQAHIARAIDEMNATVLSIAHRLETLKACSRILVLDQGQLVETGTWDDLIAKGGLFAKLVSLNEAA